MISSVHPSMPADPAAACKRLPSRRRKSPPTRAAEAAAPEWYAEFAAAALPAGTKGAFGGGACGEVMKCATCGTFDTPMWRRSPCGSLMCNACGLRARRAAASAARGELLATLAAGGPAGGAAAAGLMTMSTRGASRRAPAVIGGTVILAPEAVAARAAAAAAAASALPAIAAA